MNETAVEQSQQQPMKNLSVVNNTMLCEPAQVVPNPFSVSAASVNGGFVHPTYSQTPIPGTVQNINIPKQQQTTSQGGQNINNPTLPNAMMANGLAVPGYHPYFSLMSQPGGQVDFKLANQMNLQAMQATVTGQNQQQHQQDISSQQQQSVNNFQQTNNSITSNVSNLQNHGPTQVAQQMQQQQTPNLGQTAQGTIIFQQQPTQSSFPLTSAINSAQYTLPQGAGVNSNNSSGTTQTPVVYATVPGINTPAIASSNQINTAVTQPILSTPATTTQTTNATAGSSPVIAQPTYVNAKQYHRIVKRREVRQRMEEILAKKSKKRRLIKEQQIKNERERENEINDQFSGDKANGSNNGNILGNHRKPYIHESRHKHAMKRPRGPGGRFLTKDELAKLAKLDTGDEPTIYDENGKMLTASAVTAVVN